MDFFHGKGSCAREGASRAGGLRRRLEAAGISNRVEYLRSRGESRDNLGFRIVRNVR